MFFSLYEFLFWNKRWNIRYSVQVVCQSSNGSNLSRMFFISEDFLEKLDATNSRMEVKEDCQWKSDSLNGDPRHEAVKAGLHYVSTDLWKFKKPE
jgi:hypothetical protein